MHDYLGPRDNDEIWVQTPSKEKNNRLAQIVADMLEYLWTIRFYISSFETSSSGMVLKIIDYSYHQTT